jgi:hypothetical protein
VALVGSSGSGKSTAAHHLVSRHEFVRVRFAQPLKDMLIALGLSLEDVDGSTDHRAKPHDLLCGRSPRHALQTLGTEWRDMIDKRLWSNITEARIKQLIASGVSKIVVDDLRFPHELDMLARLGATVIAIRRPDIEVNEVTRIVSLWSLNKWLRPLQHVAKVLVGITPHHLSEVQWFDMPADFSVYNTADVDDMLSALDGIIADVERGLNHANQQRHGEVSQERRDRREDGSRAAGAAQAR